MVVGTSLGCCGSTGLMPTMTIELSWYMAAHCRELSREKSTLNYCSMFYFSPANLQGTPWSYWSPNRFTETFSFTNLVVEVV